MQGREGQVGGWEDRFLKLIKHTRRTKIIIELTAVDATPIRMTTVRQWLEACVEACATAPNRQRP